MKRTHFVFLVFLGVFIGLVATGCSLIPRTYLEILQYSLEKETGDDGLTFEIVGSARNSGTTRIDYAEVKGSFYDETDTLLATACAETISPEGPFSLDPGEIWNFTIPYPPTPDEPAYPSLTILECALEKDSSGAALVGSAENDGNVTLAFAKLTGHFLDADGNELTPVGTATVTNLEVGEVWDFTIYFARYDAEAVEDGYVKVEDPDNDLQPVEKANEVDHVSVEVGTVRGSSVMP